MFQFELFSNRLFHKVIAIGIVLFVDIDFYWSSTMNSTILSTSFSSLFDKIHCIKSVRIRSYSGPYFPALRSISLYSVQMREYADQNNSAYRHFTQWQFVQKTSDVTMFSESIERDQWYEIGWWRPLRDPHEIWQKYTEK